MIGRLAGRVSVNARAMGAAVATRLSRREWALVALVAVNYIYFLIPAATNTISRYDMVAALAHGTAVIDDNARNSIDVSFYNGHYYSPRSLGLSLLAVPGYFVAQAVTTLTGQHNLTIFIAILTALTVIPVSVGGVAIFGRLVARLRPSLAGTWYPLIVATALALGTLYYPFAMSFYGHAFAGALDLIAFYLLVRARSSSQPDRLVAAAGLLVGFAVISEYPSGVTMLILAAYVWAVFPGRRLRMLILFGAAMAPSALLLAWYNWFAFGNPLHLSYEFVAGHQFSGQHTGFFGVTLPSLDGLRQILIWPRGLLVNAPMLVFVPLGFYRWLRSTRRPTPEAMACLAICVLYPLLISSYFLPMAGENQPGPRLLVPMLPFACIPLAWVVDDMRRWIRRSFEALLCVSVALSFLWVALGSREYHTYTTYPVTGLFLPLLATGHVPSGNQGDTPPNLAHLVLHIPQIASVYLALIPIAVWMVYLLRQTNPVRAAAETIAPVETLEPAATGVSLGRS